MRTFKPSEAELALLVCTAKTLKQANADLGAAKKAVDSAKESLAKWLNEARGLDLNTLKIGEIVNIEAVCLIKVTGMNKFDEGAFSLAQPKLHAEFKKELPVRRFDPLV